MFAHSLTCEFSWIMHSPDLFFSVIFNRTLLWKYPTRQDCTKFKRICETINTAEECDSTLVRAPWVPSYLEWGPKLGMNLYGDAHLAPSQLVFKKVGYAGEYNDTKFLESRLVNFGRDFIPLRVEKLLEQLPPADPQFAFAYQTARDLFSLGKPFLYWMLFRYLFDFDPHLYDSIASEVQTQERMLLSGGGSDVDASSRPFTVGIHTRHNWPKPQHKECDISREQQVREITEESDDVCRGTDDVGLDLTLQNLLLLTPLILRLLQFVNSALRGFCRQMGRKSVTCGSYPIGSARSTSCGPG